MTISRLFKSIIGTSLLAGALLLAPQAAQARVFVSVNIAPPAIPVYEQPIWPGDGYIWTPGYWAYTDDGYEWVDGAWVLAPYTGALWTPGYWGYDGGSYFWNAGYWGPTVGYYGGINYGFGYFGVGFYGGYWNHGAFFCNREYNHFGGNYRGHNFYSERVGHYDGRPGGTSFARGGFDENRGGSLNHGNSFARPVGDRGDNGGRSFAGGANGNRGGNFNNGSSFARGANNGFVQNGGDRQIATPGRNAYIGNQTARGGFDNGGFARGAGNGGYNPSAGPRVGFSQPIQARPIAPTRSFGGGENFNSNLRPTQGGNFQSNPGGAGRSFSAPPQRSFQGGGGAARPSAGGFQGGGGGGFHGGGGSRGGGHR